MTSAPAEKKAPTLPELRADLQLVGMTMDASGAQLWKLYDPIHHRFTAIGQQAFAMLDSWSGARTPEDIVEVAWRKHSEAVSVDDVQEFAQFLIATGLATSADPTAWRRDLAATETRRKAYFTRALHNYLFFRIPVCDPEPFLRRTLPIARTLASRSGIAVVALMGSCGLYLLSREWDVFLASALGLGAASSVVAFGLALFAVKVLHELAHGYAAVHFGSRVPTLGVAFILGMPLLFVDVTDSWRVKSKRARLIIDAAGIAADVGVSVLATVAWVFLPVGPLRDVMFFLASAGWVSSFVFNLNPFMKFDGYHIIADALSLPNLHERAMEFARWRAREVLFGFALPAPESVGGAMMRGLAFYGWSLWLYRLVLFTGIAIAVYVYFFKLLGIVLFVVEIGYFIVAPVVREISSWITMRRSIRATRRSKFTFGGLIALFAALIVPWSTAITVPAVLEPKSFARLHVPRPARIAQLDVMPTAVTHVAAHDVLVRLESPQLAHELRLARLKADLLDIRLARVVGDATDRENATVLREERRAIERTMAGITQQIDALVLRTPTAGTIASHADYLSVGRWLLPSETALLVHGEGGVRVRGLVEAWDKARITVGQSARFIPQDLGRPSLSAVVDSVATANAPVIDQPELAEPFGGAIPASLGSDNRAVPLASVYAVVATLEPDVQAVVADEAQPQVGVLIVYGARESLLLRFWSRALMVLVRESGF